jgi:beta-lactamase superfamily II metal-dependent hydrolase
VFSVTMLPAQVGDSLWIEYGPTNAPNRMLVDCGTSPTWNGTLRSRLEALDHAQFELLIVTHVDSDHIGGVLPLLSQKPLGVGFDRVWFNAWRHLDPDSLDIMGPVEGEILSVQLDKMRIAWNRSFQAHDHAIRTPGPKSKLVTRTLPGGMRLTVVAPTRAELDILKPKWKEVVEAEGLVTGTPSPKLADKARRKGVDLDLLGGDPILDWANYDPTDLDDTEANGSSIAILAEFDDPEDGRIKRCLLTGDAHGPVLTRGVRRLANQRGQERLVVDVVKLPHHGSVRNVTRPLIQALDAETWLFSSNGKQHGHPHKEAVARVVIDGPSPKHLKFNYRTPINEPWDNASWKATHGYDTEYGDGMLTVQV